MSSAGEKHTISCVRHYLVVVTDLPASRAAAVAAAAGQQQPAAAAAGSSRPALVQVFDLRNKLLAGSLEVPPLLLNLTHHEHLGRDGAVLSVRLLPFCRDPLHQ